MFYLFTNESMMTVTTCIPIFCKISTSGIAAFKTLKLIAFVWKFNSKYNIVGLYDDKRGSVICFSVRVNVSVKIHSPMFYRFDSLVTSYWIQSILYIYWLWRQICVIFPIVESLNVLIKNCHLAFDQTLQLERSSLAAVLKCYHMLG